MSRASFLGFIVAISLTGLASADELRTVAGKNLTGKLTKIAADEIVLATSDGPLSTPTKQALEIVMRPSRAPQDGTAFLEVRLIDESLLACTKVTFGANDVQLDLTSGASIKAPLAAVVSILRDAQDSHIKKQWQKLLRNRNRRDRIVLLRDGDLNSIEGTLGDIDPAKQKIKFKRDGAAEIELGLERLQGLQFVRTDVPTEPSLCKIIDVDGNTLVASRLDFAGKLVNLTTPFGQKVDLDPNLVASIDFNFGRLTYLSDLDAKSAPALFLGGFNPVRKDRNLNGDEIMLQEKTYPKGLSMYAGAELTYDLAGKYSTFKAVLGADARIAEEGQGKVIVSIYCDNEKRFTDEVSTKAVKNIVLNVKDVSTLRIVVAGSNFTNYSGHATLANANVSQ